MIDGEWNGDVLCTPGNGSEPNTVKYNYGRVVSITGPRQEMYEQI